MKEAQSEPAEESRRARWLRDPAGRAGAGSKWGVSFPWGPRTPRAGAGGMGRPELSSVLLSADSSALGWRPWLPTVSELSPSLSLEREGPRFFGSQVWDLMPAPGCPSQPETSGIRVMKEPDSSGKAGDRGVPQQRKGSLAVSVQWVSQPRLPGFPLQLSGPFSRCSPCLNLSSSQQWPQGGDVKWKIQRG